MKKKCLLSVAMIVKDEEHNIRRALESIKDCVDEIVVVDTGSTDRTPQIVREYTDKLYFHEWRNDFSEARNYSLKFPTCEWVMILDADEEASEEFRSRIRSYLESLPKDVNTIYVPTISYLDWDFKRKEFASTARIFRNGTVHYENIVHNKPVYKPKVEYISWPIYHYGYIWTRKLKKKKYDRTATLIREFLKRKDLEPGERLYYLVQLYKTEAIGGKVFQKSRVALQTFSEMKKSKVIPTIAMEFFYYFAGDLMNIGLDDIAEEIAKMAVRVDPEYPDIYYIMLGVSEKRQDWDGVIEWGEKFLKVCEKTLESMNASKWTVNFPKVMGSAWAALARAYLRKGELEKAHESIVKSIEQSLKSGERIDRFLSVFMEDIRKLEKREDVEKITKTVIKILEYSKKKNMDFDSTPLLEKCLELNVKVPEVILKHYNPRNLYQNLLKARLEDGKDHFIELMTGGERIDDFVEKWGPGSLVFLMDVIGLNEESLKILNELRKSQDERISGLALAFMGDVYLKNSKFKEALLMYRKSLDKLPELSNFLKPVIEDLKSRIESDIEGVFDEIYKYYSKGKEFVFDVFKAAPKELLEKAYLISDSDHAYYVSAIATEDTKVQKKLLEKISRKDHFPFYYFRMAKIYEKEKMWKEAYMNHVKACEENEKLGDIRYSLGIYHGLYMSEVPEFSREGDEIVWSGNISETFSTLKLVDPVRMWRRSKLGFFYTVPYHVKTVIRKYFETLEKSKGLERIDIDMKKLIKHLISLGVSDIDIKGMGFDESSLSDVLKLVGLERSAESSNLLVPFGLETMGPDEFERELKRYKKGVVVFFSPLNESSKVWRYPPFRIMRPINYMTKLMKEIGFAFEMDELDGDIDAYVLTFKR